MNDFANKYKNAMKGVSGRQQSKDIKKQLNKALHMTFKRAMEGQVAGLLHLGQQYVMVRQDVLQQMISTGGRVIQSPEQKEFFTQHQILLTVMGNLNVEIAEQNEMFTEIDSLTFDFSQAMAGLKKDREVSLKKFNDLLEKHPFMEQIKVQVEPQVRQRVEQQLSGQKQQKQAAQPPQPKVENNGKLT